MDRFSIYPDERIKTMKQTLKILSLFSLFILLIVVVGILYIAVSSRVRQNRLASELNISQEEESNERDARSLRNYMAFFHAVEYLVSQAAENERTTSGLLPLPDSTQEMPMRSLDTFFTD